MDCPMLPRQIVQPSLWDGRDWACTQGACAWWDWENSCCAVLALAKNFQAVAEHYGEARHYRPQAGVPPRTRR